MQGVLYTVGAAVRFRMVGRLQWWAISSIGGIPVPKNNLLFEMDHQLIRVGQILSIPYGLSFRLLLLQMECDLFSSRSDGLLIKFAIS